MSPRTSLGVPRATVGGVDMVFAAGAAILCVVLPGLLGGWQVAGVPGAAGSLLLQLAITVWAGLRLARLAARGEPRPFAIIFWLFVYVWLGLAGMLQVIHQTAAWPIVISSSAMERGQIIILVGLAAVEMGHLFPSRTKTQWQGSRRIVGSRVNLLVAFVLVTAPFWYRQVGGFHALFSSREALKNTVYGGVSGGSLTLGSGGLILALSTVPSFLALYAVIVTGRYRAWRRNARLVLTLLVLVVFVLNSPISMPRFWIVTMLVALIFAVPIVQKRPSAVGLIIAMFVFASVALFPYAAFFRYSSGFRQPPSVVQTLTVKPDYDSFEMIAAGTQYTFEAGYRYGQQFIADLLFFVPRSIWSAKAQDTGSFIGSYNNLRYTNLSAPLWIEMYIDFGYVGVVAIFFLYGMMMRRADDRFVKRSSPFVQFAVPLLAGYSCILLRGSLLQAMARLSVMLAIMWLISVRGASATEATPVTV